MRDPAPPPPLPPAPVLPVDKQDTMVLNKKPDKQPAPKPPDPKPAPPEVKIGPRIVRSASTPPRPVRVAPKLSAAEIERLLRQAGSASGARTTHAQMSAAEIERQLKNGALSGVANSIPDDEISRCMLLIKRALYAAWDPPSRADAGPRPAELELRFGTGGRIISTRLTQPSGSVGYDRSVTAAAAAVDHVDGLTTAFLQRYDYRLTVEFKLEE
jgi:hypothetical protein